MLFHAILTVSYTHLGKAFDGFTMENVEGKWYQLLLVPQRRFTHREKPSALMLLFRDVSKQKERDMEYQENLRRAAEEATLANAAKTDFLRRMSHDIRTPINGIDVYKRQGLR